ncbi:MAG TPA: hypothetical protein VJG29_00810 [Candidatus Paceibacterota bacterium]
MATNKGTILNLYKRLGETPRERLERLRREKPRYENEVLSYAGRLDPMAEGVLLALVGSENNKREGHLNLSKEYVVDILFGFATDTYDILGKVKASSDTDSIHKKGIKEGLWDFQGTLVQEYPPFSSKTVEGKSLFSWARNFGLDTLVLPQKEVTVYAIELQGIYKLAEPALLSYIEDSVAKVNGDFRQEEILRLWHRNLSARGDREFPCATVRIECSSGTYVRSIANRLGENLEVPALALHILRTKVGEHDIKKALR